jgi:hypothetical protein
MNRRLIDDPSPFVDTNGGGDELLALLTEDNMMCRGDEMR